MVPRLLFPDVVTRGLAVATLVSALAACSDVTGPGAASASIEIDGPLMQEETGQAVVLATIRNTGADPLLYPRDCTTNLQWRDAEGWQGPQTFVCTLIALPPVEIAPGESHTVELRVDHQPAGEYRVHFSLYHRVGDRVAPLPLSMRTSEPFQIGAG